MKNQAVTRMRGALLAGAGICLLAGGWARAEEKAGEKPPDKPAEAPPVSTFADEPPFVYDDGGRRDPFTFTKPIIAPTETAPGPDQIAPSTLIVLKEQAERNYLLAEQLMMAGNPREAITACDKGLEGFREIKNIEEVPDLQDMRERLFRLRKAADRLRSRADAEQAFKNLNLRVSGVVARDRDSRAIVNNKVVGKGDLILASDNSEGAIVDDIVPGRVVVRFRGYKMVLDVAQ
ncbi:MAG: hypothetical protein KIS92_25055 [Planctomycetota bacterium]|nr:hypothetical protein [Planctomycetota bacterium]